MMKGRHKTGFERCVDVNGHRHVEINSGVEEGESLAGEEKVELRIPPSLVYILYSILCTLYKAAM
jgi:hypothetical protein